MEQYTNHPLLVGLYMVLPPAGAMWTQAQRRRWHSLAALIFALLYEDDEPKPTMATERAPAVRMATEQEQAA